MNLFQACSWVTLCTFFQTQRTFIKRVARRPAVAVTRQLMRCCSKRYHSGDGTTLVFAPHQDDETLGCGGLIARKRCEGLPVHVVFITDGSMSHPGHATVSPNEIAALRRAEALRAMAILGIESDCIHFLDQCDGSLGSLDAGSCETLKKRILEFIEKVGPDEIFLPCRYDGSSEHDSAFIFICEAVCRSRLRPSIWQYPVWAWWNPNFLIKNLMRSTAIRYLPTGDFHAHKLGALECYRSQIHPLPPWDKSTLPPELYATFKFREEYFFRHALPRCD